MRRVRRLHPRPSAMRDTDGWWPPSLGVDCQFVRSGGAGATPEEDQPALTHQGDCVGRSIGAGVRRRAARDSISD